MPFPLLFLFFSLHLNSFGSLLISDSNFKFLCLYISLFANNLAFYLLLFVSILLSYFFFIQFNIDDFKDDKLNLESYKKNNININSKIYEKRFIKYNKL